MDRVKLFTDSCSDLPCEIVRKYNITMLPTPVHFGEDIFLDRDNLSPAEFYRKIDESTELPKTSQITPAVFMEAFKQALDEGYKVLSINFSSKLSGIFAAAVLAKENIGSDDIRVIDSRCASVGFGMAVVKAAKLLKEGKDLSEVIETTLDYCSHMEHIFAVGSLEMLKRGGRIRKTTAFVGNILNIKPILHFQDGEILPLNKVRGEKKMLQFLLDTMEERGYRIKEQEVIGINHSANLALAERLREMIKERFGVNDFLISEIGAAIGAHVGRNTVSVFFQNKDRVANPVVK